MGNKILSFTDLKKNISHKVINYGSHSFLEHSITAIYGESGKGKSTLLKIISGIEKYNEGQLAFCKKINPERDIDILLQKIILPTLTVRELLHNIKATTSPKEKETEYLLEELIKDIDKEQLTIELSGGQQVRVMLYIIFSNQNKIILLDEPTAHQDEKNSDIILKLMKKAINKSTILIASHKILDIATTQIIL